MEKKYIFLILLLLTIGFASVNTYLDLNGKVDMSMLESDLEVVFKEVLLNKENSSNAFIIEEGKSFIYSADDLNNINDKSELDYVVMNQSHQYDVEVRVSCTTDYEENLNYNGTFDNNKLPIETGILIEAGEIKRGNIITELIKENNTSESLVLKCTLSYIPVSRDTVVEDEEYIVSFDTGYEESVGDIRVRYYEEYGNLPELTRSNYKFLGWYTEEDVKVENNSLVKIRDNHTLKAKWDFVCPYEVGQTWNFAYTGGEQSFTVPCDGNYKLETWGASGGNIGPYLGGRGAYTLGEIELTKNRNLYVYVGGQGTNTDIGGYNGGSSLTVGQSKYGSSGGGATDIRLNNGTWDSFDSLKSRIMVSAGGGGANNRNACDNPLGNGAFYYGVGNGGSGGALTGIDGQTINYTSSAGTHNWHCYGVAASQTKGGDRICLYSNNTLIEAVMTGSFGTTNYNAAVSNFQSGAGGGYYVGGSGAHGGAGGGSSFISGHSGCNAVAESSTSSKIVHTGQPNHYSGYVFTNTKMIAGNATMPTHDGTGTMTGNSGNGYAKLTLISIN